MSVELRAGAAADLDAITGLDPVADRDERQRGHISGVIRGDRGRTLRVLTHDGVVAGYTILGEFFGHPFLEHICVAQARRRQGAASALMADIEARLAGDRLFVSTNESNAAMRALLVGRGYRVSGMVENLDPGDPELFFVIFKSEIDAQIEAAP